MLNPLGAIITQARKALLQPSAPSAAAALGGYVRLLIPLGIVAGAVRARPLVLQPRGPPDLGEALAMSAAETSSEQQLQAENERLRARVAALEAELVEIAGARRTRPSPRPRSAPTGSTAGTSTSTR